MENMLGVSQKRRLQSCKLQQPENFVRNKKKHLAEKCLKHITSNNTWHFEWVLKVVNACAVDVSISETCILLSAKG